MASIGLITTADIDTIEMAGLYACEPYDWVLPALFQAAKRQTMRPKATWPN